jgi:hypothetical protein
MEPGVARATPRVVTQKHTGKKTKPAKEPHPVKPVQAQVLVKGRSATAPGHTKAAPEPRGKGAAAPGHTKTKTKPKAKLLPKPAKKAKPVAAKVKKAKPVGVATKAKKPH